MPRFILAATLLFICGVSTSTHAQAPDAELSVEELKQKVLELNRDLLILEEELLFPANTQIAVFVSMDTGQYFRLDSIRLEIDGKPVTSHLYTERELDALHRGGIQRLYVGNVKSGDHDISAFYLGQGPEQREYKRALEVTINKGLDPTLLELQIRDSSGAQQPEFTAKEWESY